MNKSTDFNVGIEFGWRLKSRTILYIVSNFINEKGLSFPTLNLYHHHRYICFTKVF